MAQEKWTSGLGIQYDGMFQGTKLSHSRKVEHDRTLRSPLNKHVTSPENLIIPEKVKFLENTVFPESGLPYVENVDFYRKTDHLGNMVYQSNWP